MLAATTIQAEIEQYMMREGLTISRFAQMADLNSGTVSNILRGNRLVSIGQLDKITAAMGLPKGTYYDLFLKECLESPALDWRRLGPFMNRCAELDKLDLLQSAARCFMDNLSYGSHLFEMAEYWFREKKMPAAAILYQTVAESEKYQHSERLALCQYRIFKISLSDNYEMNLRAASKFEDYVDSLEEIDQLDALKDLIDIHSSLHNYNKVDNLAVELGKKAQIQYELKQSCLRSKKEFSEPSRALVGYILYSYLMRGVVCEEYGEYDEALNYVSLYDNPEWVQESDEATQKAINKFHFWATANKYLYKLMKGDDSVLSDYINYVFDDENEILLGLSSIVKAANKYHWDIDDVLERFDGHILSLSANKNRDGYNQQVINDQLIYFLCDLSFYHFNRRRYSVGIGWILKCLEFSYTFGSKDCIIRCLFGLFAKLQNATSVEEQVEFQKIIFEVQKKNEEKMSCFDFIN